MININLLSLFGIKSPEEKRQDLDENIVITQQEISRLEQEIQESKREINRLEMVIRKSNVKANTTPIQTKKIDLEVAVQDKDVLIRRLKERLEGLYAQKRKLAA
ncbi:MAG: hypothetical protein WC254_05295 [Candidatus Woesearchaeota archaeon]